VGHASAVSVDEHAAQSVPLQTPVAQDALEHVLATH